MRRILLLFLLSSVLRVAAVLVIGEYKNPSAWASGIIADALVAGRGFAFDWHLGQLPSLNGPPPSSAWYPPVYPLFLAACHFIKPGSGYLVASLIQAVLSAGLPVLILLMGLRLFGNRAGWLAALVSAVHPPFLGYSALIQTALFDIFWTAVALFFALRTAVVRSAGESAQADDAVMGDVRVATGVRAGAAGSVESQTMVTAGRSRRCLPDSRQSEGRPSRDAFLAGVSIAMAGLTRGPALALLVIAPLAWVAARVSLRRMIRQTAALLCGAALLVGPWMVRNHHVLGALVISNSKWGWNFYMGNNPAGTADVPDLPRAVPPELASKLMTMNEVGGDRYLSRLALDYIRTHPGEVGRLVLARAKNLVWFNRDFGISSGASSFFGRRTRLIYMLTWAIFLPLAVAGMVLTRTAWRRHVLLYGTIAANAAAILATTFANRYRAPIVPVLILFAGVTLARIGIGADPAGVGPDAAALDAVLPGGRLQRDRREGAVARRQAGHAADGRCGGRSLLLSLRSAGGAPLTEGPAVRRFVSRFGTPEFSLPSAFVKTDGGPCLRAGRSKCSVPRETREVEGVIDMKRKLLILAAVAVASLFGAVRVASAQQVNVSLFYDSLAPYGEWVNVSPYGECWVPAGMPADWEPYSDGRWVYTDYGWTWVSDFDWGWAPYHYGTWVWLDEYGWTWVPGDVWGPAWVAWCESDGYIGWEPVPYGTSWGGDVGLVTGRVQFGFAAHNGWTFVRTRDFLRPRVGHYRSQDPYPLFRRGRVFTGYRHVNGRVFDEGIPVRNVEHLTGRSVTRYRVVERGRVEQPGRDAVRGREIVVTRTAPERSRVPVVSQRQPRRSSQGSTSQQQPRQWSRGPTGQRQSRVAPRGGAPQLYAQQQQHRIRQQRVRQPRQQVRRVSPGYQPQRTLSANPNARPRSQGGSRGNPQVRGVGQQGRQSAAQHGRQKQQASSRARRGPHR